jgi:hypothetical protein
MIPLPANDLRSNIATWTVPEHALPAVAKVMTGVLPVESFDAEFQGQQLCTTYFDTTGFDLYKARLRKPRYITIRIRCYNGFTYALSAKTEDRKFRVEIEPHIAELILSRGLPYPDAYDLLPADLQARILDLSTEPLLPVVTVSFRRYAVEDDTNRLTLDVCVTTDRGKRLASNVLEQKSTAADQQPYGDFAALGLRPVKLSKFLWATMF